MPRCRAWIVALALVVTPSTLSAAGPTRDRAAEEMAARIDQLLDRDWKAAGVVPAAPAGDAEWLRRVYLDVAGRIPSVTEARDFLDDRRADKRSRLVEKLLGEARYPTWFARVWRGLLLPEADTNLQLRIQSPEFERWLRDWLTSGRGYDAMVRDLLTAQVGPNMGRLPFGANGINATNVFYVAKENKPEELAATASRLFLGVNLGCAQCHHHPFAAWKREQFWSFAAFFTDLQGPPREAGRIQRLVRAPRGELKIPGTEKVVKAAFLDGKTAKLEGDEVPRRLLARWMTSPDNPYFAKAAVNRMWAHFFGSGLSEPLDEMAGTESTPSHPEVLDELARGFARKNHDPRWLIRVLTATKAYQRTSARSHPSQEDARHFARMPVRGLSGEQLFDSLVQATGLREEEGPRGRVNLLGIGTARGEFLTKFAGGDRTADAQTSILQALTLMNGRVVTQMTSERRSELLQGVIDAPFLDTAGKVETLYLATLSRRPTDRERSRLLRHVEGGVSEGLADVFWALLNSAEFVSNH